MKYYDKDIYEKDTFIKTTLIVLIVFWIGFFIGYICLCDQLEEQEQTIINQNIELESLRETVWMDRKESEGE